MGLDLYTYVSVAGLNKHDFENQNVRTVFYIDH